jgi:UDP-N-acetylmuramoyl-L-alanyl-D-glutamate--2,6-diaminopimelate ligase
MSAQVRGPGGRVSSGPLLPAASPIPLSALAAEAGAEVRGDAGVSVADATYAAVEVRPGSLFFCVPGAREDGHDFAAAALAAGAAGLVVEMHPNCGWGLCERRWVRSRR